MEQDRTAAQRMMALAEQNWAAKGLALGLMEGRLEMIRRRADAATDGPWSRHDFGHAGEQEPSSIVVHTGAFDHAAILEGQTVIASMMWDSQEDANAEFIARSRGDVPALLAAVEAVRAIHVPSEDHPEGHFPYCVGCHAAGGYDGAPPWPCPTIEAIIEPLSRD